MIYRKQYESPRYPEMRRRKPLFAALVDAAARVMNAFLPGKTDVRFLPERFRDLTPEALEERIDELRRFV